MIHFCFAPKSMNTMSVYMHGGGDYAVYYRKIIDHRNMTIYNHMIEYIRPDEDCDGKHYKKNFLLYDVADSHRLLCQAMNTIMSYCDDDPNIVIMCNLDDCDEYIDILRSLPPNTIGDNLDIYLELMHGRKYDQYKVSVCSAVVYNELHDNYQTTYDVRFAHDYGDLFKLINGEHEL